MTLEQGACDTRWQAGSQIDIASVESILYPTEELIA